MERRRADERGGAAAFRSRAEAEAWRGGAGGRADAYGPATERMLDLAGVGPGGRVLALGAGTGDEVLLAARRVGPGGAVLATDVDPHGLALAAEVARAAGLANVATRVMDAGAPDLEPASCDAAIARLVLMFVADLDRALAGVRRVLVPGGRLAAIVFSTPERNPSLALPQAIARRHARLAHRGPEIPTMFSLGAPGVLLAALRRAGFRDAAVEAAPTARRFASAAEHVRSLRGPFVAMHRLLTGLGEAEQDAVWAEVEQAFAAEFQGPDGYMARGELVIGSGTN